MRDRLSGQQMSPQRADSWGTTALGCYVVVALGSILFGCAGRASVAREEREMSEIVIDGIRLRLAGPDRLPLSVVDPASESYDREQAFFELSFTNESTSGRTLPFDELSRNTSALYRNPASGHESFDNRTPPPRMDGSVESIAPNQTKMFQVVFDYPEELAPVENGVALVQFCVKWEESWLRAAAYQPNAYDWNHSYELCANILIIDQ